MVAFRHNASYLPNRLTHVTPGLYSLLQKHNKKLFDMCNLGEEFHLGAKRNEILQECNRILEREDF